MKVGDIPGGVPGTCITCKEEGICDLIELRGIEGLCGSTQGEINFEPVGAIEAMLQVIGEYGVSALFCDGPE